MSWTKNESVVWEEMDGATLLIDTESGARWTLSATASAAWKLCDGKRTLAEMSEALRQSRESIQGFCEQLASLGLLKGQGALGSSLAFESHTTSAFSFQLKGVGTGLRRRPSPRGNSGPG